MQMYLWLDTERGMEFRRQVPVALSEPPWNNNEALASNISVLDFMIIVISTPSGGGGEVSRSVCLCMFVFLYVCLSVSLSARIFQKPSDKHSRHVLKVRRPSVCRCGPTRVE